VPLSIVKEEPISLKIVSEEPARNARADLPETFQVGPFDTGISMHPKTAAFMVNAGGKLAGSYRGVKQLLGIGQETENEAALRRLEADPDVGGYATAGGILGMAADPVTLALPVAKGKSLLEMAKYGAAGGAVAGALNPLAEGDSRAINAATGMAGGTVLAPVIGAAVTRGRMPFRTPVDAPANIGVEPGMPPVTESVLSGQEATKQAIRDFKARKTRALAPDLANPDEVQIQEVLARRRAEFGGINPQLAAQSGGGAVGAAAGALTADENASPGEIASRALLGGVGGWQLAKYGANKIGGYRPGVKPGSIPAAALSDSVNVIGDAAEPLFTKQLNPQTEKGVTDLAKAYYAGGGKRTMPDMLISDEIKAKILSGEIPVKMAQKYGVNATDIANLFRDQVTVHATAMGRLSQVYRELDKSMTPEERSAFQAAGNALEDAAYIRPFWKKLTDVWRGLLVTQPATAVRNAITQAGRVGLDVIQAPINHWVQRMTGRPVTTQPLDGFEELISMFQRNKESTDKILSAFPSEGRRLFNHYLSDIAVASKVEKEGKVWDAIDSVVQAANILNRTQEFIIRRGIFQTSLAHELRHRGLSLPEIIKTNQIDAIPHDAVRNAVENSLNKTFATTPEWGTASRKLIDAINAIPGATMAIPFPRFMYNAIKFQYEYSPMGILSYLSKSERDAFVAGNVSKISKAVIGSGLLGAASLMRNSEHAGEKWYEYIKDDGSVADLRPFNPFASYLFVADLMKKQKDGTLYKLTGGDIAQGLLSTNMRAGTGLYLLDNVLNMMSKTADEKKLGTKAAELTGDFLSGFLTPLTTLRDAYDQITDGKSITRDTRQQPFVDPLKSRIPGVSQTLPAAQIPTREGPKIRVNPLLRQVTGLSVSGPKNPLEKELDRLGFDRREVLPSTGDKELDSKYSKAMGAVSEKILVPVVSSEKFKAMADTVKGVVLSELLSEIRNEVRAAINESLSPDKQLALELKKQPPRIRLMLKEFAPQLFQK